MYDLYSMLIAMETGTLFITGIGIALVIIVFNIGIQRSLLNGIFFASLVMMTFGIFFNNISAFSGKFIFIGAAAIVLSMLIGWMLGDKPMLKVGGAV